MSEFPQLQAFLNNHVDDVRRRDEVGSTIFPFLASTVNRGYEFRPLIEGELEQLRLDLEKMLGVSVTEVRVISLNGLLMRLSEDESDTARSARVELKIKAFKARLVGVDDLLSSFDAWCRWRVPDEVMDSLIEAFDTDLPEPKSDDLVLSKTALFKMSEGIDMMGIALLAAAAGDDILLERFLPILRWFSRCMPVGGDIAEPGVFVVVAK